MGIEKNLSDALGIDHEEPKKEVTIYEPVESGPDDQDEDYRLVQIGRAHV